MFSVSPSELVTIALVALLVFGPKRLPEITRRIGRLGRELSKAADQMREARKRIDGNELTNASRRGAQAKQFLERSRELLEELQRNLTGEQLAQAMKQLEKLRQEQEKLRRETEAKAAKGEETTAALK